MKRFSLSIKFFARVRGNGAQDGRRVAAVIGNRGRAVKRWSCAALAAVFLFSLSACQKAPVLPNRWPLTVGTLTIEASPRRVAVLSPGLAETLYALGYGARVVGVGDGCDQPMVAASLPRCGSVLRPDSAAILELTPDLVISPTALPESVAASLASAEIPVLVVPWADTSDGVYANWGMLCRVFEGDKQGALREEQLRYYAAAMLRSMKEALVGMPDAQDARVVWLRRLPRLMATGDTMEGEWLTELGFSNPAQAYTAWNYPADASASDPDLILYDSTLSADDVSAQNDFKDSPAVKNDRLVPVDGNVFERQVPLMFSELSRAMEHAYPEAFANAPAPQIAMPMPEPPPPKKSWLDKLLGK